MSIKVRILIVLWIAIAIHPSALFGQTKGKLERLLDKVYRVIEGDSAKPRKRYYFALPIWGVAPETGWKLGLSVGTLFHLNKDSITRPSLIRLNTQYTEYRQFSIRPTLDIFFRHNRYNLKAQFIYNNFNEYYWGIGNRVTDATKELYDFRMNRINLRLTRQVIPHLYVGPQLQFERLYSIHFNKSSLTPFSQVSGINGYRTLGTGIALAYDNRDHIYFPKRGVYLELSNYFYSRKLVSDKDFINLTLDFRGFRVLWKDNVLAGQVFTNLNWGDVPYRQMGTAGNDMIMRGYYNGRYRDHHMYAFQTEMRMTIWGPVAFAVFAGGGNVGNSAQNLFGTFIPNYGLGLRGLVIRKEHINIRMDLGLGQKGIHGLYFTMAEAF